MRVVLATFNPDKRRELETLAGGAFEVVTLAAFPGAAAPEEYGATLEDNARIKALAAVTLTGLPAIADDTGLAVDALGGAPGVHAARYAGPHATYADNVAKLLAAMAHVPDARRTARFESVCVARFPDGGERIGRGVLEGRIGRVPRGAHGFGYDPVFELPDGRTLAELPPDEKDALSHRARAMRDLLARWSPERW